MTIDPNRLYTALLNTGLQQKNQPLYQVIHDLIKALASTGISSSSSSSSGTVIIQTNSVQPVISFDEGSSEESIIMIGSQSSSGGITIAQVSTRVVLGI